METEFNIGDYVLVAEQLIVLVASSEADGSQITQEYLDPEWRGQITDVCGDGVYMVLEIDSPDAVPEDVDSHRLTRLTKLSEAPANDRKVRPFTAR